jgi:hypothetical protein
MRKYRTVFLVLIVMLRAEGHAQTYTTNFDLAENPISENGAWSHAGLDWKKVQTMHGAAYGTQTGTGGYDDSYAHLSGFPPNQSAFGVIRRNQKSGGIHEVEIHLRWADSAHFARGYECLVSYDGSYAQIVRWNGPLADFTYIGWAAHPPVPKTGDTLKAQIAGSLITVFYNGAELMRATDSTWKTGDPGMGFYRESSPADSDMAFSSYTAVGLGTRAQNPQPPISAPRSLCVACRRAVDGTVSLLCELPTQGHVALNVFDMRGREVATLANGERPAGSYVVPFVWPGMENGTYAYKMTGGRLAGSGKVMIVR